MFLTDETDNRILALLREDARISYSAIGEEVGLSRTAVKARMDALERRGILLGYTVRINPLTVSERRGYRLDCRWGTSPHSQPR